jgi:hypothetical protein
MLPKAAVACCSPGCPSPCHICTGEVCVNDNEGVDCGIDDCKKCSGGECVYKSGNDCEKTEHCSSGCDRCIDCKCTEICDPDYCESCIDDTCKVCGGDTNKACCNGECYNKATQGCCDGLTIYNKSTKKCCNDGQGNTCPIGKECCEGECCDPDECEECIDAECVVCEGTGITCCDGDCCEYTNETCCDDNCCPPVGSSNGCGPRDDDNPESHDNPAWLLCSGPGDDSNFRTACDAHDECYGACGNSKSFCDDAFDADMDSICAGNSPLCFIECGLQTAIYNTVVWLVGVDLYTAAQECACCLDP